MAAALTWGGSDRGQVSLPHRRLSLRQASHAHMHLLPVALTLIKTLTHAMRRPVSSPGASQA